MRSLILVTENDGSEPKAFKEIAADTVHIRYDLAALVLLFVRPSAPKADLETRPPRTDVAVSSAERKAYAGPIKVNLKV